jgi:hypothetical protein
MEARTRIEGASVNGPASWLNELQALAVRFSGYGIGPDLAGLTLAEPWGLCLFLRRLAAEA